MNRRLALLLPQLGPGGLAVFGVRLAEAMTAAGWEVDLVLMDASRSVLPPPPAAVGVVDLGATRVARAVAPFVRYLRRRRPAAVVASLPSANLVALTAARVAGVATRVVVSEHNPLSAVIPITPRHRRVLPAVIRRAYRRADAVVAVSPAVADDLAKLASLPRRRIDVVYSPVLTPEIFDLKDEPVQHPWFGNGEPPVVLSAGRLTGQKDYATLVRAFALVRAETSARLVILGEGDEREPLSRLVADLGLHDDVAFPGWVANPYAYMARAPVFALSSAYEGLGIALVEALALGAHVVSTRCGGGLSALPNGERLGRLVPIGDVHALAAAVRDALRQPPSPPPLADLDVFTPAGAAAAWSHVLDGSPLSGEEHAQSQ